MVNYNGTIPIEGCRMGENRGKAIPAGSLTPNAWGVYNMHGNVAEWCHDSYADYPADLVLNPQGPPKGRGKVFRGGSWRDNAARCRSAFRDKFKESNSYSFIGFRVVEKSNEVVSEKPVTK
jgi:formylglycine-generating enzyme required for sulfatase activity